MKYLWEFRNPLIITISFGGIAFGIAHAVLDDRRYNKTLEENKFHISHTSGRTTQYYYTNSEIKYNKDCCEFVDAYNRKIKICGPYSVSEK